MRLEGELGHIEKCLDKSVKLWSVVPMVLLNLHWSVFLLVRLENKSREETAVKHGFFCLLTASGAVMQLSIMLPGLLVFHTG